MTDSDQKTHMTVTVSRLLKMKIENKKLQGQKICTSEICERALASYIECDDEISKSENELRDLIAQKQNERMKIDFELSDLNMKLNAVMIKKAELARKEEARLGQYYDMMKKKSRLDLIEL